MFYNCLTNTKILLKMEEQCMYYNYNNFNQNTIFNFIICERGTGKTYELNKRKEVKERSKTKNI